MSVATTFPTPPWATDDKGRISFILRLAATFHNDRGSLTELSKGAGLSPTALNMAIQRGKISPELAIKLEGVLGRELFPREAFVPDLFNLPAGN